MIIEESDLKGVFIINLEPIEDDRGWFSRFYCKDEFSKKGITKIFVQFNHSFNRYKGTLRGMHYQNPPKADAKLIRCISGSVYDVIVDLRSGSPTFLKWIAVELSARNRKMIYIPEGFAHGFQTLEDNAELIYHHSEFYEPTQEGAIRYNDELINIKWPEEVLHVSDRDKNHPLLSANFTGINV